jgi:multidrug resistance efflux pump
VRSVDAAEGDLVVEGDTLVTFDQAVDAADMATLRESIRALESIVESGGSSEAEVMLKQEQERLSRLESGQQQGRVSAPASGTLTGFTPKAGEKLRARQVIGTVVGGNSKTVTGTVDKADGAKLKKGAKVRVRSASRGEVDGVVTATKKKGSKFVITVEVAGGDATDVDAVRVP